MKSDTRPLVVHVIYALGTGGMENGLVNIINRAPADRYRHAIICLTKADSFAERIARPDVEVIELHKQPGHDLGLYWRLWRTLMTLKPAIVHTRNLAAMEMQLVTLFVPGARSVHGEHGRDIYDLEGKNWKYNALRKIMRLFISRYICVSKDLQNWLLDTVKVAPKKLRHIYNGVDQARFVPRQGPADNPEVAVGTVGRLAEVKNQQFLIRAVAHLLENANPNYSLKLVLIGDGPQRDELEQLVCELGVSDVVCFMGDRSDIPDQMRDLDIFVLPSLGEGISNTILEAMATGLPVIATAVGGNLELVKPGVNGELVPVNDVQALAEAIDELARETEQRKLLGKHGLQQVRQTFNWQRTVDEYLAVYDELLGKVCSSSSIEQHNN